MTAQEFLDKYGTLKVKFSSYYKYVFNFKGRKEGLDIYVSVGGSHDDIYRFRVEGDKEYEINSLGVVDCGTVQKDGVTIEDFYEKYL